MNLVRKLKLDSITRQSFTKEERYILNFMIDKLLGLITHVEPSLLTVYYFKHSMENYLFKIDLIDKRVVVRGGISGKIKELSNYKMDIQATGKLFLYLIKREKLIDKDLELKQVIFNEVIFNE